MKTQEAFKEITVKRFFGFAIMLASLSVPALAAKNSQTVAISDPVKVGSTQLPAGEYKVSWTGTGPNVQVTIAEKGGNSVTVPAKLVDAKNGHVALLTNSVGGARVLESIQLENLSLILSGASNSGE
jgi:Family of unknown function (DUF5849)